MHGHNILTELQTTLEAQCPAKSHRTDIDFLTLYKTTRKTDPVLFVYEPRIYIVIQGQKEISVRDKRYVYNETQYLVSTIDIPVSGMITEASPQRPYLAMCLSFAPMEIFEVISGMGGPPEPLLSPYFGMGLSELTPDLLDALWRLLNCLPEPSARRFLAPRIKQEIIYRMLHGAQGSTLCEIANYRSDLSGVNRAILYLRQHFRENFEISLLPGLTGMSQSKFYQCFQDATHLTPVQYRMRLRVQEARRLMLHEGKRVAEAGFDVGYDSPSQFNREYRKLFGLPPHADIKRIRSIGMDQYCADNEEVWL